MRERVYGDVYPRLWRLRTSFGHEKGGTECALKRTIMFKKSSLFRLFPEAFRSIGEGSETFCFCFFFTFNITGVLEFSKEMVVVQMVMVVDSSEVNRNNNNRANSEVEMKNVLIFL